MADALCRHADADLWFPGRGESTTEAVEICQVCPVTEACLDYAQAAGIAVGVFGGLTAQERRQVGTELTA